MVFFGFQAAWRLFILKLSNGDKKLKKMLCDQCQVCQPWVVWADNNTANNKNLSGWVCFRRKPLSTLLLLKIFAIKASTKAHTHIHNASTTLKTQWLWTISANLQWCTQPFHLFSISIPAIKMMQESFFVEYAFVTSGSSIDWNTIVICCIRWNCSLFTLTLTLIFSNFVRQILLTLSHVHIWRW